MPEGDATAAVPEKIASAHAYVSDGVLVIDWRRPDRTGYILLIEGNGTANIVSTKPGDSWASTPPVEINWQLGWPVDFLKEVDVDG